MTTLFPGAQDDFPNPLGSVGLAAGEHAAMHGNVHDAIEAIEAAIGTPDVADPTCLIERVAAVEGVADSLGTAALLDVGTTAGSVVQLDGSARLPAVDGSQLTNLPPGVTNGNSHDHSGGDGAQIAYSGLSGLPTLGSAAALTVGTTAGTVAAGDDARFAVGASGDAYAVSHEADTTAHTAASVSFAPAGSISATTVQQAIEEVSSEAGPAETVSTIGALIAGATAKATPVDADSIGLSDSESAGVLKKWSWANIKTSITTALTGVFAKLSGVAGGQTLIGGTNTTNKLDLQGTSANGISTATAVRLLVGNNGGTVALEARNDGNVAIKAGGVSPQWALDIGGYGTRTSMGTGTAQNLLALKGDTNGPAHIQMYNANTGADADARFSLLNDARTSYMSNCTPSDAVTGFFFDITKATGHFIFCNTISGGVRSMGIGTLGTGNLVLGVTNRKNLTIDGTTRATKIEATDATTNAVFDLLTLAKNSTAAGAIGLGVRVLWTAKSSTTEATEQAAIETSWVTATHASRKARVKFSAYDSTGAREVIRIEANGTAPLLGFYGVAAVAMPSALTAQSTSITHTAPGTPDYAIQALSSGGYGFATQDEGHTLLSVVANLQIRLGELETKLRSLGLLT